MDKKYLYYGSEFVDVKPISDEYPGINNPRDLYDALTGIWCAQTCAPGMRANWTPENMTLGQCSITSFLAQEIFGGKVYGLPLEDGNYHCFNDVNGAVFDLTSEQFGGKELDYANRAEQFREDHFINEEKRLRFEHLKKELFKATHR